MCVRVHVCVRVRGRKSAHVCASGGVVYIKQCDLPVVPEAFKKKVSALVCVRACVRACVCVCVCVRVRMYV